MTDARAQLWLGISDVGCILALSLIAFWLDVPRPFPAARPALVVTGVSLASFILISFSFDLSGGYLLPEWQHRASVTFPFSILAWLRGALSQTVLMGFRRCAILHSARYAGTAASIACAAVLMLVVLPGQAPIAGWWAD